LWLNSDSFCAFPSHWPALKHAIMGQKYIFHHDHYYHTLKDQIGHGIPVFHGVKQRGSGLGSVLGSIAKYAIPLILRYVVPHAKTAAIRTLSDVATNRRTLKDSLKTSGIGFLHDVGTDLLNNPNTESQSGKGIVRRRKRVVQKLTSVTQIAKTLTTITKRTIKF